jgi:hypothetical protein
MKYEIKKINQTFWFVRPNIDAVLRVAFDVDRKKGNSGPELGLCCCCCVLRSCSFFFSFLFFSLLFFFFLMVEAEGRTPGSFFCP